MSHRDIDSEILAPVFAALADRSLHEGRGYSPPVRLAMLIDRATGELADALEHEPKYRDDVKLRAAVYARGRALAQCALKSAKMRDFC